MNIVFKSSDEIADALYTAINGRLTDREAAIVAGVTLQELKTWLNGKNLTCFEGIASIFNRLGIPMAEILKVEHDAPSVRTVLPASASLKISAAFQKLSDDINYADLGSVDKSRVSQSLHLLARLFADLTAVKA